MKCFIYVGGDGVCFLFISYLIMNLLLFCVIMKIVFINFIFVFLLWLGCGVGFLLNCLLECGCEDKENGFLVNCVNKGFKLLINFNDFFVNIFEL